MDELKTLIQQFMPFAKKQMGFTRPPRLFLRQDAENASNPLGKTGFYDPQGESITIYVTDRHPKDILRSLAHELMHHTQKCNGDFENTKGMGEQGYAQNNAHMRNMEIQAYQASIVFRDWEDSLKETIYYEHLQKGATNTMSTKEWKNGELTTLLSEAWGFNFNLQPLNETGAKDTGASKGDKSKTHPGEEDYTTKKGGKTKKGEKAFEDPSKGEKITTSDSDKRGSKKGDEAYVNEDQPYTAKKEKPGADLRKGAEKRGAEGTKKKTSGKGRGEKKGDDAYVNEGEDLAEDSGREESDHDERNRDWDDDHISAIRHHLDALEHDRDYDDDHIDEGGAALRQGNEDRLQQRHAHPDRMHESHLDHDAVVAEVSRRVAARLQGSMTDVASTRRAEQNALGGNQVTEKQLRTVARQVVKRLKETKKNG